MKIGGDDFLAGGGSLQQLLDSSRPSLAHWEPGPDTSLTNSVSAERLEQDVMVDEFRYVQTSAGWLAFNGRRWGEGVRSSVSAPTPTSCWSSLRVGCRPSAAERAGQASVRRAHQGGAGV